MGLRDRQSFTQDLMIPVENDTVVGAGFHLAGPGANILYFHGNGEIVADYDNLAEIYNDQGLNFLPVDYRGYGRSNSTPTVTSMLRDAGVIFEFVVRFLNRKQYTGPIIVMGRSLGSASALELSASHARKINGLIIESGFADTAALLGPSAWTPIESLQWKTGAWAIWTRFKIIRDRF